MYSRCILCLRLEELAKLACRPDLAWPLSTWCRFCDHSDQRCLLIPRGFWHLWCLGICYAMISCFLAADVKNWGNRPLHWWYIWSRWVWYQSCDSATLDHAQFKHRHGRNTIPQFCEKRTCTFTNKICRVVSIGTGRHWVGHHFIHWNPVCWWIYCYRRRAPYVCIVGSNIGVIGRRWLQMLTGGWWRGTSSSNFVHSSRIRFTGCLYLRPGSRPKVGCLFGMRTSDSDSDLSDPTVAAGMALLLNYMFATLNLNRQLLAGYVLLTRWWRPEWHMVLQPTHPTWDIRTMTCTGIVINLHGCWMVPGDMTTHCCHGWWC